jgi:hypothetical protein
MRIDTWFGLHGWVTLLKIKRGDGVKREAGKMGNGEEGSLGYGFLLRR